MGSPGVGGKPRSAIRLRPAVTIVTVLLSILALSATLAVVLLLAFLGRQTSTAERAAVAVRAAEAIRVRLLVDGRESAVSLLSEEAAGRFAWDRAEDDLVHRVEEARRRAGPSLEESRALDDAERRIREYMAAHREAERRRLPVRDVLLAASGPLDAALAATDRLVDLELLRATHAETRAREWERAATLVVAVVGLIFLLGLAAAMLAMRRLLYRPIVSLHDAIGDFASGNKSARAFEQGPAELRATARIFNQMAGRLARQEQDRLAFVGGVAHDLRNPLGALKLATHLLDPARAPSEESARERLAMVNRQISRLDRMVGDLLDASRIEAGRLELRKEVRDLRGLAREVVRLYEAVSPAHRIVSRIPDQPVPVLCDPMRMDQVLNNLVSNAIKYSPRGGVVEIAVSRREDAAVITVRDEGAGIPEDEMEFLFEPFRRGAATRDTTPGVGLGLSVVRRIVEAHDGRICVDSRVGLGSTFQVQLPLAAADLRADAPPPA